MSNERERLKARFDNLFQNGLTNIKFMVIGKPDSNALLADVNVMQDTIAANEFSIVETIDKDCETRDFREPL